MEAVTGRSYGPAVGIVGPDRVARYVAATGDDPANWTEHAPPSMAGALLFEVAPLFLADADVAPFTTTVIHADQVFRWNAPLPVGSPYTVTGVVERVRERAATFWVSFTASVEVGGAPVIESTSTFLLSSQSLAEPAAEEPEPRLTDRGELPGRTPESSMASASRLDLVRYAAASGDVNPIHWDHDAAVEAGLPGVIVHGLLTNAWITRYAARGAPGDPRPLASLKTRFRVPIRPARAVTIGGPLDDIVVEVDGLVAATASALVA